MCLSTIHIYIILKLWGGRGTGKTCLSTIHIYIILKLLMISCWIPSAWVPYIFTSFSNCMPCSSFNRAAWVPYIFTSFSNSKTCSRQIGHSLSTIHIYIILKRLNLTITLFMGLSTIHIYIILKPQIQKWNAFIRIKSTVLKFFSIFHICLHL